MAHIIIPKITLVAQNALTRQRGDGALWGVMRRSWPGKKYRGPICASALFQPCLFQVKSCILCWDKKNKVNGRDLKLTSRRTTRQEVQQHDTPSLETVIINSLARRPSISFGTDYVTGTEVGWGCAHFPSNVHPVGVWQRPFASKSFGLWYRNVRSPAERYLGYSRRVKRP